VAGFIGTPPMNFIPATLADGGSTVVASGFRLPVPPSWKQVTARHDGKKVILGVRPENIREAARQGGGGTVPVTARVEFVEPLGHEVIVHGRVGDDLLVAKVDPHRTPEMGTDVQLVIEADAIHLFDAGTEQRLAA
jgi:multiple sugar transport system ATP-binding protein